MDIDVREVDLPGVGRRYELPLDAARTLVIVVLHDGGREVAVISRHTETPDVRVPLTHDQAIAVAALLTGARFSIETRHDEKVTGDEVAVETAVVGASSAAVGQHAADVTAGSADAAVLAVIRDETPEVVEDVRDLPLRPGDRVVVAARRERLGPLIEQIHG
ncbi:MAG: hypothetical protein ACLFXM_02180 [Acidimicrobiia bacterium]